MPKLTSYYQGNDNRKPTGGIRGRHVKVKRKALGGGPPRPAIISPVERRKVERAFGGNRKVRLVRVAYVNVFIPSEGRARKARIVRILESPANREFLKRGIIVKGTVVETEVGKAVVTSRPSQEGVANALLIEGK